MDKKKRELFIAFKKVCPRENERVMKKGVASLLEGS